MTLILKPAWYYFLFSLLLYPLNTNAQDSELPGDPSDPVVQEIVEESDPFETTISKLNARSFTAKIKVVKEIASLEDERVLPLLKVLVEGDLCCR